MVGQNYLQKREILKRFCADNSHVIVIRIATTMTLEIKERQNKIFWKRKKNMIGEKWAEGVDFNCCILWLFSCISLCILTCICVFTKSKPERQWPWGCRGRRQGFQRCRGRTSTRRAWTSAGWGRCLLMVINVIVVSWFLQSFKRTNILLPPG